MILMESMERLTVSGRKCVKIKFSDGSDIILCEPPGLSKVDEPVEMKAVQEDEMDCCS